MNTAYLLLETAKRLKHQLNTALSKEDTTAQQWAVLEALNRLNNEADPITAARIADAIDSDRQTTAAVVLRLADKGWLNRTPSPADKRAVVLALTAAGKAKVTALKAVAGRTLTTFLQPLPDAAQHQLAAGLTKLLEENHD